MARGPRYRRPLRRRLDGKTDYHKRLKLLKSRKLRVVIRSSNNHMRVQIVQSKLGGDKILISAFSKELPLNYGWTANTGNIPASYLTGYLAGLRAKKNNIQEAIFDLGMVYNKNRVLATCKGVLDAGIQIPYNEEFFPEVLGDRIKGHHIESYATKLKSEDPEKYERIFSAYLKNKKVDPMKISKIFSDSLKMIDNNA
ncbi:MAG: 50S ribosomal protein L18 [Candidatus Lokiarchaeota archaeon]|nr:50S ribosomal protein L18 [Candidatus Lokiarchaeota archaeon]